MQLNIVYRNNYNQQTLDIADHLIREYIECYLALDIVHYIIVMKDQSNAKKI